MIQTYCFVTYFCIIIIYYMISDMIYLKSDVFIDTVDYKIGFNYKIV